MPITENKIILVTGATGLAGSGLINSLLRNNYSVFALSRIPQATRHENLNWIKFDAMREEIIHILKDLPKIDGVIHAAAHIGHENTVTDIEKYRSINMEFSDNLFNYYAGQNVSIPIIYFSTLSSLQKPLNKIVSEEDKVSPNTFYSMSKYWGELSLLAYSKSSKIRPVIFRISSPVGNNLKHMHNTVIRKWIEAGKSDNNITVYGTGNRTQNFVSTSDIAEAALLCLKSNSVSGTFNIASGTSISMIELAKLIAGFFKVGIDYKNDENEVEENWNISIHKATESFGYKPGFSSTETINNLLQNTIEDSRNK